jgi:hypothetical protein
MTPSSNNPSGVHEALFRWQRLSETSAYCEGQGALAAEIAVSVFDMKVVRNMLLCMQRSSARKHIIPLPRTDSLIPRHSAPLLWDGAAPKHHLG